MSLNWAAVARGALSVDGPAAFDGDLSPANVLAAAGQGFYCFPAASPEAAMLNEIRHADAVPAADGDPYGVAWLCPDPRPVAELGARRTGRTLRRLARRRSAWQTTVDAAFDAVVAACAAGRETPWITSALADALRELHRAGAAHSCEVWDGDRLVGGAFGLGLGAVFTADSQFTAVEGAGKLAVADLMARFAEGGGQLFDFQTDTVHTRTLGAAPLPRAAYLDALRRLRDSAVAIPADRRPADHLAEPVAA